MSNQTDAINALTEQLKLANEIAILTYFHRSGRNKRLEELLDLVRHEPPQTPGRPVDEGI